MLVETIKPFTIGGLSFQKKSLMVAAKEDDYYSLAHPKLSELVEVSPDTFDANFKLHIIQYDDVKVSMPDKSLKQHPKFSNIQIKTL